MSKNKTQVTLTYEDFLSIINTLNPLKRGEQGPYRDRSEITKAKGMFGLKVYYLRDDLNKAFEPIKQKVDDIREEFKDNTKTLRERYTELTEKEKTTKKEDEEKENILSSIEEETEKINKELEEINKKEETVTLRKGKLDVNELMEYASADEITFLEKVVNFKE